MICNPDGLLGYTITLKPKKNFGLLTTEENIMRQRYRMYEDNALRLGRLIIHWTGAITTMIIIAHVFLEVA